MGFYCGGKYVSDSDFENTSVICALDKYTGRQIALKRWDESSTSALCEIEIWSILYPELFIESCTEDGYMYLAREWIKGETLYEFCMMHGTLPEHEIVRIFEGVCEALAAFYKDASMVFCDIKPENVIINGDRVFLIDFESAQAETSLNGSKDEKKPDFCEMKTIQFASRAYCAPEIYHGEVSFKSDIYSLGVLLLFLFTGNTKPSAVRSLSSSVAAVCTRCLCSDEENRYDSAKELCAELRKAIELDKAEFTQDAKVIQVQNMTVNAKHVSYSSNSMFERQESSKTQVKKDGSNVVVFPKNRVGYRRVILYIPGNAAFAAELAFMSAKLFGMRTAVFDVNEYYTDRMRHYLPLETSGYDEKAELVASDGDSSVDRTSFAELARSLFTGDERDWLQKGLLVKCTASDSLFVSSCNVMDELELNSFELRDFAVWCYSMFDVTIISDSGTFVSDLKTDFMRVCDYVTVPVDSNIDDLIFSKRFFSCIMEKTGVPVSKLRYVGWNYTEEESVDHEAMVMTLGENIYLGTVRRDTARQSFRNIRGKSYCDNVALWVKSQYGHIINNLLFGCVKSA